ncbi:MAG: AmmeMemoRadiSam system radical SAM enzyme [Candidatus Viridilinea halotolerans]|uniref:AmmeMemoRadiSam system radical SAM enzyme n=1 Tax=Candidatus Viridilinea halotolerans TaxID=2491704 RepID=A0A426TRN1_9CHLR|nr:MAG: AmmeMemoRadiSam system radical SAM enzyme [Candidatus Viridilinea halotolerans]
MSILTQLTTRDPTTSCLRCGLCAHRCIIHAGQVGRCGAMLHQAGQLRALAHGHPVVLHADPIERKPLYHVLPGSKLLSLGTLGCNMACSFCQNWRIAHAHPDAAGEPTPPSAVLEAACAQGCQGIAFTYNEPTIYLDYAAAIMQLAHQAGLICMFKSNGYMTTEALALLPELTAINIDLKSFSDSFYQRICGARLQPVLETIAYLQQRGIWLEITTLLIPGLNDSDEELRALTNWLAALSPTIPWHIWRFHPDHQLTQVPWTQLAHIERAIAIGREAGLHYIYTSNLPGDPHQHTACASCGTLLIERTGNRTSAMHLVGGGCAFCGAKLPGRWG